MTTTTTGHLPLTPTATARRRERADPVYQAFELLHVALVIVPLVAGMDKLFGGLLTHWEKYLAPGLVRTAHVAPHTIVILVGVVEIVAAGIVAFRPRIGAYVVAGWLVAIIVNLLLVGGYLDLALRDLGLCLAALALGRLSPLFDSGGVLGTRAA
jgi:hypothetical protein